MLSRARGWLVPALVALLVPALLVGFAASTFAASTPKLPGDPKAGAQLWATAPCASCHGANLEGGVGPPLNPIKRLSGVSNPLDPSYLIKTITDGRPASDGYPSMPAKGGDPSLSAQDIANLASYIIQQNLTPASAGLSPQELARSTVEWVAVGILAMVLLTWMLARYNMRWVARKAARR